jgi:RNA polymerase sigma-70 factor, ECF subfamily
MPKSSESLETSRRNPLSFEEYCLPLYQELMNYARGLSRGDVQQAHDVVQDSLVRAMRAWHAFVPHEGALSVKHAVNCWMFRIVHNTFVHIYKKNKRGRLLPEKMLAEGAIDEFDHISDDPRNADVGAGDEVLEAVARLLPHHRQVIEMHYLQEMTPPAIALELGIPKNTVFTRLHRARAALKKLLANYAEESYRFGAVAEDGDDVDMNDALPAPMLPGSDVDGESLEPAEELESDRHSVDRVVAGDDHRELLVA